MSAKLVNNVLSKVYEVHYQVHRRIPIWRYRVAHKWDDVASYYAQASHFEIFRDFVFFLVVSRLLAYLEGYLYAYGLFGSLKLMYDTVTRNLVDVALNLPVVKQLVDKKIAGLLDGLESDIIERPENVKPHSALPEVGLSGNDIKALVGELEKLKRTQWEDGRISGAVYHGGNDLLMLQTRVFGQFTVANQLHPDCFPAVRTMEAEVVAMVLDLYNGPPGSGGTSTSGGTESLLLTCLSAREYALKKKGITKPEMVVPITAHAGFDKAAHYFGIRLLHAPVDPRTYKVDLKAVEGLIGPNTILIAGSAPNYPHGIMDDIVGLSDLAVKYRIPLHVDACLGSFIVPFLETLGVKDVPLFDFRLPGVTSISCDTHKYGFAPKGSSVIMYRNDELRHHQYFVSADWSGGVYASPTLAGSRPGALMAGCWATLLYMGKDGYLRVAKDIVSAAHKFKAGIRSNPILAGYLKVIGEPVGSVVAFTSNDINIYDLSDKLKEKAWHLSTLQNPAAIHIAFTRLSAPVVDDLLAAIEQSVQELASSGSKVASDGTRSFYGIAGTVQAAGLARRLASGFVDFMYKL